MNYRMGARCAQTRYQSSRHTGGLYALYNALKAVVPPVGAPPAVQLCDRGDGTPQSVQGARRSRDARIHISLVPKPRIRGFRYIAFTYRSPEIGASGRH